MSRFLANFDILHKRARLLYISLPGQIRSVKLKAFEGVTVMATEYRETTERRPSERTGFWHIPRSRGVISGLIILLLGIWVGLIPFVGPYFNYEFASAHAWLFTTHRLWFDILPGAAAFLGGIILAASANRATAVLGGWLALAAGVWLIVGVPLSGIWGSVSLSGIGVPAGGNVRQALEQIGFFFGAGAIITTLAAVALGRLSVLTARDVHI